MLFANTRIALHDELLPTRQCVPSYIEHCKLRAMQGLHVGDRFTESGNDSATRDCCPILWVANPEETDFLVSMLLKDIRASRAQPYIE